MKFKSLGKKGSKFQGLETFNRPENCKEVKCVSDEVTAVCPITGQPDYYVVTIEYQPKSSMVESKSLKMYLGKFRNEGLFCEAFADKICEDIFDALSPHRCEVTVVQKPRGGIAIHSTSVKQTF